MEALKGLLTPRQGRKIRFRAMTESYDLIDSVAERVDTQLIEHGDGVSVRDREPVTLYKLLDHDSMPTSDCSIIVETGLFRKPESRSRWVLQEALHIWLGYAEGTLQDIKPRLSFDNKSLRAMSMFTGTAVLVICIIAAIVIAAVGGGEQPMPAPATTERQTVSQGADHGWVETETGTEEGSGETPSEEQP